MGARPASEGLEKWVFFSLSAKPGKEGPPLGALAEQDLEVTALPVSAANHNHNHQPKPLKPATAPLMTA